MSDLFTWDVVDAGNDDPAPDGAPEGQTPQSLNNVIRMVMGALRRYYADPQWLDLNEENTVAKEDDDEVRITGIDLTTVYVTGRRIQVSGAASLKGFVVSSLFSGGDTVVTVKIDGGAAVAADTDTLEAYHSTEFPEDSFTGGDIYRTRFFA